MSRDQSTADAGNSMLSHHHHGVYGLINKSRWSCCANLIEHVQGAPHSQLQGRRCVLVIYSVKCVYCILRDCIVQKFYLIKLVRCFMWKLHNVVYLSILIHVDLTMTLPTNLTLPMTPHSDISSSVGPEPSSNGKSSSLPREPILTTLRSKSKT